MVKKDTPKKVTDKNESSKVDLKKVISWKSVILLKQHCTRFWNIKPRRFTTFSVKLQKKIRKAIINAREFWLLPYVK